MLRSLQKFLSLVSETLCLSTFGTTLYFHISFSPITIAAEFSLVCLLCSATLSGDAAAIGAVGSAFGWKNFYVHFYN